MTYKAVDIPFFRGQDESFDRKVLPVGPLRRVENSYQERTGRMVERRGTSVRPGQDVEGTNLAAISYRSSLPRDRVIGHTGNEETRGLYYDKGVIREADGHAGGPWGFEDEWRAASKELGPNTFSPSVGFTTDSVIFVYISGVTPGQAPRPAIGGGQTSPSMANLVVYDRETMRIVRQESWRVGAGADNQPLEIKVAANEEQEAFAVGFRNRTDGLFLYSYAGRGAPRVEIDESPIEIFPLSTFDMVAAEGDAAWVLNYLIPSEGMNTTSRNFDSQLTIINEVENQVANPTADTVSFQGCAILNSGLFYGFSTADAGAGNQLRRQSFTGAGMFVESIPLVYAPIAAIIRRENGRVSVGINDEQRSYDPDMTQVGDTREVGRSSIVGIIPSPLSSLGGLNGKYVCREDRGLNELRGTICIIKESEPLVFDGITEPSGMVLPAGGSDSTRYRITTIEEAFEDLKWTPSHPVGWQADGVGYYYIPFEERVPLNPGQGELTDDPEDAVPVWQTVAGFVRIDHHQSLNNQFGVEWDDESVLISGLGMLAMNDSDLHFAGFTGVPGMSVGQTNVAADSALPPGDYDYIAVMEYTDASGRLWQSAPTDPVTQTAVGTLTPSFSVDACAGFPIGSRVVVYRTEVQPNSVFHRRYDFPAVTSVSAPIGLPDTLVDEELAKAAVLYTEGDVVDNDPPPKARFLLRAKDRFWAGRLGHQGRLQCSKFTRPTEGVHWSNQDSFFVDLPRPCTGLARMDDAVIAFADNAIYVIHGEGPNDQGIGAFPPIQTVPTDVGCIEAKSIVIAGSGVYFQSRRGIELFSRGYGEPAFIGDPVRDVVDQFPFCLGSVVLESDKQIRWLMSTRAGAPENDGTRVIVYDTRVQAWSVFVYAADWRGLGRLSVNDETVASLNTPRDAMTMYAPTLGGAEREALDKGEAEVEQVWETGEMRVAGLNAGAYGRRFHLLGTYKGECDVTVTMAHNDKPLFESKFSKTWNLRDTDYSADDAVRLELTLPVMKFSSIRFLVTAKKAADGGEGFQAHGITLFFDTEGEGPRVGARSKG